MTMNSPRPYTLLITGAASGIGRCFAQHYLRQPNTLVIALDINEIEIPASADLDSDPHERRHDERPGALVKVHTDMSSSTSITSAMDSLKATHGVHHIDLIIHSAGIRGLVPRIEADNANDVAAAETLHAMDAATMLRTYQINTLGTFTLLQSLSNHSLFHAADADAATPTKVIIMSSRMGSISSNTVGGGYAYRASKAALNAIVRSMSIDLPHVVFALVHPGRVETGLTRCREEGAIEVEESVGGMLGVIGRLRREDSGRYMDRFGVDIGW
ncbi:hypothetical protein LTR70_002073 [Exophiala xenobiotica]|uniref:NAD(P)-binding protein n=1 Tax=Lithohypha guttulata TaxID=1690604 RepID=A0ABR0KCZ6_9EURO|nr:hypothetical protein LTR24_004602 [Lithohypha guttulata]KAK5326307.1 hypothetical protein LTR70_002073 [Exophiala xenobiotica]